MPHDPSTSSTQVAYQNPRGCLLRLFWMGAGNLLLFMTALWVYKGTGWSIADLAFAAVVLLMIGVRYVDIVRYEGTTADGDPATLAHLKRYALMLILVAAAVWVVARALGPGFSLSG